MICEYCKSTIDGLYGSGRFCDKKCARGFSTKYKRLEINKTLSLRNKDNRCYQHLHTEEVRQKRNNTMLLKYGTMSFPHRTKTTKEIVEINNKIIETKYKKRHQRIFSECSNTLKKKILIEKYGHICMGCGLSKWQDNLIPLELDHIDGNHQNNDETNFRILCLNCHSMTPTFRRKKSSLDLTSLQRMV